MYIHICDVTTIFLVRMHRFFLTSDTINILCLAYLNFLYEKKNDLQYENEWLRTLINIFCDQKFKKKLSKEYQWNPKSKAIGTIRTHVY